MSRAGLGGDGLVRAYVITGGRASASRNHFDLITLISITDARPSRAQLNPEQAATLNLLDTKGARSVAEISAALPLAVSLLRILLADLMESGHITVGKRILDTPVADRALLEAVLAGLQNHL
ncbi:DUF742 domain-containing protein [Streptomyces parvus]|uniref:DUF742 domain-containing protein n=1 Tax=Streptomyces parvus TaxID=66428 RepID=UPI0033DC4404